MLCSRPPTTRPPSTRSPRPCARGLSSLVSPAEVVAALERAGGHLGLAFQLADDLIGAFGSPAQAGRAAGGDLREAKRTPLIALARESSMWNRVSDALAVAHTGPIAVREAQQALDDSGARTRLLALVDRTLAEARDAASDPALPAAARTLVAQLAHAIAERVP